MSRRDGTSEREFVIGERVLQDFKSFFKKYDTSLVNFKKIMPEASKLKITPCCILSGDTESQDILSLVESDNKILAKILLCLASLCKEITFIVKEVQLNLNDLFRYEDSDINNHPVKRFGNIMKRLLHLRFTFKRCQQVIQLLLKQLCAILGKRGSSNTILFPEPMERLAELLIAVLTLDTILSNKALSDHMHLFQRVIKTYGANRVNIGIPLNNLQSLNDRLKELESEVLSGTIFSRTINQSLDDSIMVSKKVCNLSEQFALMIQQMIVDLEKDDNSNNSIQQSLLRLNVLAVFYHHLAGSSDKKVIKRISQLNRKISSCVLNGNVCWDPNTFLSNHVNATRKSDVPAASNIKINLSTKESRMFSFQICQWLMEFDRATTATNLTAVRTSDLRAAHDLLLRGVCVFGRVRDLAAGWLAHAQSGGGGVQLRRADTVALCQLLEMLKAAQLVQRRSTIALAYLLALVRQQTTYRALCMIMSLKRNIREEKKYKNEQLDILSTLSVIEHALKGTNSADRILIAKLALSASGLSSDETMEMRHLLNNLEIISNFDERLHDCFDTSIMHWYRFIFDIYLNKLFESETDLSRLQLTTAAMSDANSLRLSSGRLDARLITSLTGNIETRLRLQMHAHLQQPTPAVTESAQLQSLRELAPAHLPHAGTYVHVRQSVEHCLSAMFYNLTTVVLHDWRTYGEMHRLAIRQYGLQTTKDNLPMHTLDQGLDILEIMRNIDAFVGNYLYNMNDHVFMQEQSNNKHLNTINITHVANSIRTHGIGIMNTAVNFTYQFLQKKFYILSQFMFDEHIKSKLLREIRYFAEHKTDTNELYPYENADKFNTDIRKLGMSTTGQSYLDLFRTLITHIGNALGYIRLVKSGGERCLADATCFMPNLQTIDILSELVSSIDISKQSNKTSECVQRDINNLVGNFQEATDYFKLLINVFAPVMRDKNNHHLRNFYMIIPMLTINFVEYSLTCKDRLNKRNREGASFTDDGFAMGVTYVTVLLKQTNIFNSLHWQRSVTTKFSRDRDNLKKQMANASKDDAKLQQTLTLSEKRIASIEKEFQLLMYNLNNAQIFFQKGNI